MTRQFLVLEITKLSEGNELRVKVLVDQEEHIFTIKFGELGAILPGELQNLVWGHLERIKDFTKLIFDVYEGEQIEFPVNLKCWEYPPEQDFG